MITRSAPSARARSIKLTKRGWGQAPAAANYHLGELRSNAKALLGGNGGATKPPTVPELADVWTTLKTAADEHDRTEERLRRSYQTYFRLIQNAVFGVYLIDSNFRVAEVSAGAQ